MFKRTIVTLASMAALAGIASAHAGTGLGFDPWYVENPYGHEVAQSHQSAATALGYDPWYVPGQFAGNRTAIAGNKSSKERQAMRSSREEKPQAAHAYADPAFGPEADA